MGIINFISALAADATVSLSTNDGVVSCPVTEIETSWIDFYITAAICVTVIACVFIIALTIRKAFPAENQVIHTDAESIDKLAETAFKQEMDCKKARYDAAWRYFNMCWKVEHPEPLVDKEGKPVSLGKPEPLNDADKERYAKAWEVIQEYIGANQDK